MPSNSRSDAIESLADALSVVDDGLADLCQDLLLDALHGQQDAVKTERELQKARRAVAKAAHVLRGVSQPADD